jgi:EF hand
MAVGDPPNACQCGEQAVRGTQKREGECSPSIEQAAIGYRHRLKLWPQRAHWVEWREEVNGWERIIMKKQILTLTTFAFILACGAAFAEEGPGMRDHEGHRMMGCSMMGRGGMMGHGAAMRVIFALMDSDGDGTVSLQEFQAAHEKIFKAMDTDKDGTLTIEEIQAFMRGKSAPKEHEHE